MDASTTLVNLNEITNSFYLQKKHDDIDIMVILQNLKASVGIVADFTVVVAFLNHRKFRHKIPNLFIINQVGGEINTLQLIDLDGCYCFNTTFY